MFTRNEEARGGCLMAGVGTSRKAVADAFGFPNKDAYYDPEKGYEGDEYTFTDAEGNVGNLYARYGCWRIGADCNEVADAFGKWLMTQVKGLSYTLYSPAQAVANVKMHAEIEQSLRDSFL